MKLCYFENLLYRGKKIPYKTSQKRSTSIIVLKLVRKSMTAYTQKGTGSGFACNIRKKNFVPAWSFSKMERLLIR